MNDRGERVPLSLVMPHVQAWIDAWYGVGGADARPESPYVTPAAVKAEHPEWGNNVSESLPVLTLASASGLLPSAIGRWIRQWKQGNGTVGYFDADRLFTGMGTPGLWATDPGLRALRNECVGVSA